jgi:hypothetical protein
MNNEGIEGWFAIVRTETKEDFVSTLKRLINQFWEFITLLF